MYETTLRLRWGEVLTKVTLKMSGTLSFWFGLFFSIIFIYKIAWKDRDTSFLWSKRQMCILCSMINTMSPFRTKLRRLTT